VKPIRPSSRLTWPALLALLFAWPGVAGAREPTAGEWLADCTPYLAVLEGSDGSDLDIMYCTGLTMGILAGLNTGARIGAISMASALTVLAGLDQGKVLAAFNSLESEDLLGFCLPADRPVSEILLVVAAHLRSNPGHASLPVTAVFFEALQAQYPCAGPEPAPGGDAEPDK
jgi:hypothetical protein